MARAEKRKYHYIYKITCKITNRFYIGMHSTDDLDDGYFGSGKRLWFSINYHGKENHVKEILEFLPSRQSLKEREKEIVNKELIGEALCMNLQEGGGGGFISEEHMKKCTKAGGKGLIEKMNTDENFKIKILNTLSDARKKAHPYGKKYDNFKNKNHSDETKQKISESLKGKGVGETNSQHGTCWITMDGLNKKIKKQELDLFISNGWVKGRK